VGGGEGGVGLRPVGDQDPRVGAVPSVAGPDGACRLERHQGAPSLISGVALRSLRLPRISWRSTVRRLTPSSDAISW
jgi:hypothetical protein